MKKTIFLLIIMLCVLCSCTNSEFSDITPIPDAVESIVFQRTNVDKDGNYTYFEKTIVEKEQMESFLNNIDSFRFVSVEPIKFSSVDYLIIFQGGRTHKLVLSGDLAVYDGLAYKIDKGDLSDKFSELYTSLSQEEKQTTSKIFS